MNPATCQFCAHVSGKSIALSTSGKATFKPILFSIIFAPPTPELDKTPNSFVTLSTPAIYRYAVGRAVVKLGGESGQIRDYLINSY